MTPSLSLSRLFQFCGVATSSLDKNHHCRGELHDAQWSDVSVEGQTHVQGFACSRYHPNNLYLISSPTHDLKRSAYSCVRCTILATCFLHATIWRPCTIKIHSSFRSCQQLSFVS